MKAHRRLEQRHDVLRRDIGLDIVNRSKNVTGAPCKMLEVRARFRSNVHRRTGRQGALRITASAPKHQPISIVMHQPGRFHPHRAGLNRIQNIDAHLHYGRQQRTQGAVGVQHDLPGSALMNPVQPSTIGRHHQLAKRAQREEGSPLRPEIVAHLKDLNPVADGAVERLEILDPCVRQFAVQPPNVAGLAGKRDHPCVESALPESMEQFVRRSQGRDDGLVGS